MADSIELRARLADVRDRIARAAARAGRDSSNIKLIAVSKTFSADAVRAAAPGGLQGGNADALYNEGVILWNGGKIPDAKAKFQAAIAANANHAESHYQLGMALVNEGKLAEAGAEFNTYLKLAPEGPNAATAKALIAQLPK